MFNKHVILDSNIQPHYETKQRDSHYKRERRAHRSDINLVISTDVDRTPCNTRAHTTLHCSKNCRSASTVVLGSGFPSDVSLSMLTHRPVDDMKSAPSAS